MKLPVAEKQCGGGYAGTDAFGNVCCMHVDEALVNNNTMANYLQKQAGYRVGMFGKYLNNCPADMQPGFDAWFASESAHTRPSCIGACRLFHGCGHLLTDMGGLLTSNPMFRWWWLVLRPAICNKKH